MNILRPEKFSLFILSLSVVMYTASCADDPTGAADSTTTEGDMSESGSASSSSTTTSNDSADATSSTSASGSGTATTGMETTGMETTGAETSTGESTTDAETDSSSDSTDDGEESGESDESGEETESGDTETESGTETDDDGTESSDTDDDTTESSETDGGDLQLGDPCEEDEECMAGLHCTEILENLDVCSECEIDRDCRPEPDDNEVCSPVFGNNSLIYMCVAPGSVEQDGYCAADSSGDKACRDYCVEANVPGAERGQYGVCGTCRPDQSDCPEDERCVAPKVSIFGATGSYCRP